jgi:hypothetical protein
MSQEPARLRGVLLGTFLAGSIAVLPSGCVHRDWTVAATNTGTADVIVRVTYAGGGRDVLIKTDTEPAWVVSLRNPPRDAKVSVLDPSSCAVLGSSDLPSPFALVALEYDQAPRHFFMDISARDIGFPATGVPLEPVDSRCAVR